jgi:hypothetical protein
MLAIILTAPPHALIGTPARLLARTHMVYQALE